jgi:hypothetical protein
LHHLLLLPLWCNAVPPATWQVAYLQQDCDAALIKIRVALRPADNCNLPPGSQVAPVEAITMLDPAAAAAVAERARKARATKGVADGKNNAAAGGAAVVDGWLGPVDEDGLMLGLDDISWDQELLLGESGEPGFGLGGLRFEPNSRLSFGLAPSRSGLGSQVRGNSRNASLFDVHKQRRHFSKHSIWFNRSQFHSCVLACTAARVACRRPSSKCAHATLRT